MPFQPGESGNPNGRPQTPWRQNLNNAIKWAEKKRGKPYLQHIILASYEDNTLAAAILRKLLPDLKSIEATVEGTMPIQLLVAMPGMDVLPMAAIPMPLPDVIQPALTAANPKPIASITSDTPVVNTPPAEPMTAKGTPDRRYKGQRCLASSGYTNKSKPIMEPHHVIKQQQRITARAGGLDSAVKPNNTNPMETRASIMADHHHTPAQRKVKRKKVKKRKASRASAAHRR